LSADWGQCQKKKNVGLHQGKKNVGKRFILLGGHSENSKGTWR